jgi:hypothetical protein
MAVRLSALRAGRPLPLGSFLILISVRGLVDPSAIVRLEKLSRFENIQLPHRESNPRPSACSIVPQPTTLLHAPRYPYSYQYQVFSRAVFCTVFFINLPYKN